MKKTNGRKSAKVSSNTTMALVRAVPRIPATIQNVSPVTTEAFRWLESWIWDKPKPNPDSPEPKAYPPLWYVGPELLKKYSDAVGHPLTLEEVQYMISRDGEEEVKCWTTGRTFIPIRYPSDHIPEDILQKLQSGVPLHEAGIYMRGQFNVVRGEARPISGSVYHEYVPRRGLKIFEVAYQSPLVDLAYNLAKFQRKNHPVWTCVPLERLQRRKEKSEMMKAMRNKTWEMIREMGNERRGRKQCWKKDGHMVHPVSDAFSTAKKLKKKGPKFREADPIEV